MDWMALPVALLEKIFSSLNCADLARGLSTNSVWNALANSDDIWREAIFNSSFPHPFSYSQKDLPWRQIIKRYVQTKRNMINRRCVQHTLGVECETSIPKGSIRLHWQSVGSKHCLIVWEITDRSHEPPSRKDFATELWDIETRTVVRTYPFEAVSLQLYSDYILEINKDFEGFYEKLDPQAEKLEFKNKYLCLLTGKLAVIRNEDLASSLIALTGRTKGPVQQRFVLVFDLRTGTKIFEKSYEYTDEHDLFVYGLYNDKLVMFNYLNDPHVFVLDVLTNVEISIVETQITCLTLSGDELWIASVKRKCMIKYNLINMNRQEYEFNDMKPSYRMKIIDGIIWYYSYPKLFFLDVSADSKCQILTWITLPNAEAPEITQLPNGTCVLTNESYVHVLSFKDEDVEVPISVLQIEPNDKCEVLRIKQGDLNKIIAERFSDNITSEIVFEDKNNRLIIIYFYSWGTKDELNLTAYKLRSWQFKKPESYHHKTAVFQLMHFDYNEKVHMPFDPSPQLSAHGPCWLVYEKKLKGAWQRTSPSDDWKGIKTKLGLQ